MVPDLLPVTGVTGQAKVDGCLSACNYRVLALAVDAKRWRRDSKARGDSGLHRMGRMGGNHRFAKHRFRRIRDPVNSYSFEAVTGDWSRGGAATSGRAEKEPGILEFCSARRRQIWAAENADYDRASLDEGECNRVLIATEKALGAVDGVKYPVAFTLSGVTTSVDRLEDDIPRDVGEVFPDLLEYSIGYLGGIVHRAGVLLRKKGIAGERFFESPTDDDLGSQISERDRRAVSLFKSIASGDDVALDATREAADLGYDFGCYLLLVLVHGWGV